MAAPVLRVPRGVLTLRAAHSIELMTIEKPEDEGCGGALRVILNADGRTDLVRPRLDPIDAQVLADGVTYAEVQA